MELRKFQTLSQGQLLILNLRGVEKICFYNTIHMGDFVEVAYFQPGKPYSYIFHKPNDLRLPYDCTDLSHLQVGQEVIVLDKCNNIEFAEIIQPIRPNDFQVFLKSNTGKIFWSNPNYLSILE